MKKLFNKTVAPTKDHSTESGAEISPTDTQPTDSKEVLSKVIILPNPAGLHARPAALLVKLAKSFAATAVLQLEDKTANVKSVVELLSLGTYHQASVTLQVSGQDKEQAFIALTEFIEQGSGEDCDKAALEIGSVPSPTPQNGVIGFSEADLASLKSGQCLKGVAVSDGLAVAELFVLSKKAIRVTQLAEEPTKAIEQLNKALSEVKVTLQDMIATTTEETQSDIISAHLALLDDPSLVNATSELIHQRQCSAAFAWQEAINQQKNKLLASGNILLAERAQDLEDVGQQVLRVLTGQKEDDLRLPERCIVIAQQLTPSDTMKLDRQRVVGFATVEGGTTSHVAILARAMNLPALCAMPADVLEHHQRLAILDTKSAQLILDPNEALQEKAASLSKALLAADQQARATANEAAVLKEGGRIEVVANVASIEDLATALNDGAEGVGLLRTEMLFVNSKVEPSLELQTELYSELASLCGTERPMVLRTLDIGGDKPVPYLNLDKEDNPFLGVRGLRLCLAYPEMFRTQIRAVLKASHLTKMHIMLPMVTTIEELITAKAMIHEEKKSLNITTHIPIGIMIEVPAAALLAHHFAPHVDFFSIGTNDLTQYTLAMDRGHSALAKQADAHHPAVLRLIHMTCQAAQQHNKWVGVCGGLASDPNAVALLIGLGVKELSASGSSIAHVKARVRELSLTDCQALAAQALLLDSSQAVRQLCTNSIN